MVHVCRARMTWRVAAVVSRVLLAAAPDSDGAALVAWLEAGGATVNAVVGTDQHGVRGVLAAKALFPGDVAMAVDSTQDWDPGQAGRPNCWGVSVY